MKAELEGLEKQFEVAKEEVKKAPFAKEQELKEKDRQAECPERFIECG